MFIDECLGTKPPIDNGGSEYNYCTAFTFLCKTSMNQGTFASSWNTAMCDVLSLGTHGSIGLNQGVDTPHFILRAHVSRST